ncbi:hypothetical protein LPJ57_004461, partial [Coemansia sp. RSA 486]
MFNCGVRLAHSGAGARAMSIATARAMGTAAKTPSTAAEARPQTRLSRQTRQPSKFSTSIDTLRSVVEQQASDKLSNRQLFARLQVDPKTMDRLDMLSLGSQKRGRFERKRWFRYNEPEVKLPHIVFFAGAQKESSFPAATLPEIGF